MNSFKFYQHFACAYGTFFLLVTLFALFTQRQINTGAFGIYGFPIISILYAFFKMSIAEDESKIDKKKVHYLRERLNYLESFLKSKNIVINEYENKFPRN